MAITAITPEDTICEGHGTSGSLENTHLILRMTITAITSEVTVCERDGTSGSLQEHNILYWGWQSLQSHQRKLWRRRDLAIFARTQQIIRRKAIAAIAPEEIVCEGDRTSGYLQEHNILFCKNTTYYTEAISAITPEETVCGDDRTSGSLDEHSILYWRWQLLQSHQRKLFVKLTGPRDLWKIHNILYWGNHCNYTRRSCLWRRRDLGISARTQHINLRMAITAVTSEETVCEGDVTSESLQEHSILFWGWQSLQSRQRKLFVKETWPRDLCKNTTYYTEAISAITPEETVCEADRTSRSLENTQHIILRMAITAITPEEAVCEGDVTSGSLQEHNILFWGWQSLQSRQRKLFVKETWPRDHCKNTTYYSEDGNHCSHVRGNCLWRRRDLGISARTQHIILRMAITAVTSEETVCEVDGTSGSLQEHNILYRAWQSLQSHQRKLFVKMTRPRDLWMNTTHYTEDGNHCNHTRGNYLWRRLGLVISGKYTTYYTEDGNYCNRTRGNCLWRWQDLGISARIQHTMLRMAIAAIPPLSVKWTGPRDLCKNPTYYTEDGNHCNHTRGNCLWSGRDLRIFARIQHTMLRMAITAITPEEIVCEVDGTSRSQQEHNILFWGWQSLQSRQRKLSVK